MFSNIDTQSFDSIVSKINFLWFLGSYKEEKSLTLEDEWLILHDIQLEVEK